MPETREQYNERMRVYMLARYHARRAEALKSLGSKCAICGSEDDLEIDHIDPTTKTISVGRLWSLKLERYLAEIELCQALCQKHHREKSANERSVPHGGGVSGKRNCQCDLCGPLKRAYQKRYRESRPRS